MESAHVQKTLQPHIVQSFSSRVCLSLSAGCLPSLATIPVFIGLYNSLTNVANSGRLDSQGFFWLPSLAGPTSLAARSAGQSAEVCMCVRDCS